MNYTELLAATQEYLQSTESTFVSQIPTFVRQAEERINREVYIPDLQKVDTGTFTGSNRFYAKPSDYLTTVEFLWTDGSGNETALIMKDLTFIREAYPNATTTAAPRFYAHYDDTQWIIGPTPDSGYDVSVTYYYDPESIVTATTSWLGDNAESALLYGTLVEAYTFLKGEPELLALYDGRYKDAKSKLIDLGMFRSKRDDYRDGEPRIER